MRIMSSSSRPAAVQPHDVDDVPKQILTRLIGKAAWRNVLESLNSNPEQAKEPIILAAWSSSIVYPLHQAVSRSSSKPIPPSVLKLLINCNPQALDYYAFLGACENKQSCSIDVIEILFAEASMETLSAVQTNANDLCLATLGNDKNAETVGMFCSKYPHLLKGDILYQACKNGMPNCTAAILLSAQKHKASISGCLLSSRRIGTSSTSSRPHDDDTQITSSSSPKEQNKKTESPLEVANLLFDMKNPKRLTTLAICVRYASASRRETGSSDPTASGYPLPVAAIGWVSPQICTDIVTEYYEGKFKALDRSAFVEWCALEKAMYMVYEKPDFDQIPEIFKNQDLIQACRNKYPLEVRKIIDKDKEKEKGTRKVISRKHDGENALDLAIEHYHENDEESCEVFSICIKYINTIQMNLKKDFSSSATEEEVQPYEYPTAFAAIGYVTQDVLHSIFRKFKHEIRTKANGKLAIKKLLYLGLGGGEYCNYVNRLENKEYMFSTLLEEGKTSKQPKEIQRTTNTCRMETIFEG